MMRFPPLFALALLVAALLLAIPARGDEPAPPGSWPMFAFENGMRDMSPLERIALLSELGYDGIGSASPANLAERLALYEAAGLEIFSLYLGMEAFSDRYEIKPGVVEAIAQLSGHGETTVIELFVAGERDNDTVREQAVAGVREVARLAKSSGLRVVLYPHTGFHIDTVGGAYELAQVVDRQNVGVMFNLCHFLKVEPESDLADTLQSVAPLLWRVSTSGGDKGGTDWKALIQPLDQGSFSQAELVKLLDEIHFDGAIGLQCFGIEEAPDVHLAGSMATWRILRSIE
ncbi:MAG: TIM barrel protein [Verrucomicrobiota bacterium]